MFVHCYVNGLSHSTSTKLNCKNPEGGEKTPENSGLQRTTIINIIIIIGELRSTEERPHRLGHELHVSVPRFVRTDWRMKAATV